MRHLTVATTFLLLSASSVYADGNKPELTTKMGNVRAKMDAKGHGLRGSSWAAQEALQPLSTIYGFEALPAPLFELPPQDNEFFLAEDDVFGHGIGPKPLRFAVPVSVALDVADGEWVPADGGHVWRVILASPNATTARVHLTGLNVPPGQEVRMSAPGWDGSVVGPIEGVGEFGNGEAWSMSLPTG
ncbi:MAG: hypothetical protein ACKO3W_06050 [bacterium]